MHKHDWMPKGYILVGIGTPIWLDENSTGSVCRGMAKPNGHIHLQTEQLGRRGIRNSPLAASKEGSSEYWKPVWVVVMVVHPTMIYPVAYQRWHMGLLSSEPYKHSNLTTFVVSRSHRLGSSTLGTFGHVGRPDLPEGFCMEGEGKVSRRNGSRSKNNMLVYNI